MGGNDLWMERVDRNLMARIAHSEESDDDRSSCSSRRGLYAKNQAQGILSTLDALWRQEAREKAKAARALHFQVPSPCLPAGHAQPPRPPSAAALPSTAPSCRRAPGPIPGFSRVSTLGILESAPSASHRPPGPRSSGPECRVTIANGPTETKRPRLQHFCALETRLSPSPCLCHRSMWPARGPAGGT